MAHPDQRALRDKYKQTPREAGIYAIRCPAREMVWIGTSLDLEKAANRHWFTLKMGNHHCPALQSAWNTEGPAAFTCDILEALDDDLSPMARDNLLKEKTAAWTEKLGADRL